LAEKYRDSGLITRIRASTRPDALSPDKLTALRKSGLEMLELGVQTFSTDILTRSRRGYTGRQAFEACLAVQESGLSLGIQLLPGLPGHTDEHFREDVGVSVSLNPQAVRLYPCLVIESTPLGRMWAKGEFHPWGLDRTVSRLSRAVGALWSQGIPVIRIGLAPQFELQEALLAGPWHPALGFLVRSRVLLRYLQNMLSRRAASEHHLFLPQRFVPELWGHRGQNRSELEQMGLFKGRTTPWDQPFFLLQKVENGFPPPQSMNHSATPLVRRAR
jgi:histone acetyltransferase (RNA polymerase elongator complex component)